jgi:hypothetical protein
VKNPEDKLLFARGLAGQLQDTIFDTKNTNAGRQSVTRPFPKVVQAAHRGPAIREVSEFSIALL